MSQLSSASVKDLLPENCFLNIDDDDEGTLNLVRTCTGSYLTCSAMKNEGISISNCDSVLGSDVSSGKVLTTKLLSQGYLKNHTGSNT